MRNRFFVVFSGYYIKDVKTALLDFSAMCSWSVESSSALAFVSFLCTGFIVYKKEGMV